ncbi:MAG: hypothetical protein ABSF83_03235 [Nitrososphaerales archaeon]
MTESDGKVRAEPRERTPADDIVRVLIDIDVDALEVEEARERAVGLFVEMAKRLECLYTHGDVERHRVVLQEGRPVRWKKDRYPLPLGHDWLGIPSMPAWLSWFGASYRSLVALSLVGRGPPDGVRMEGDGLFVRLGKYPADLRQLQPMKFELPTELLTRADEENDVMKILTKLEKAGLEMDGHYRAKNAELIPKMED